MTQHPIFWKMTATHHCVLSLMPDRDQWIADPHQLLELLSGLPRLNRPPSPLEEAALRKLFFFRPGRQLDFETGKYPVASEKFCALLDAFNESILHRVPVPRGSKYGVTPAWALIAPCAVPVVASRSAPYPFERADEKTTVCVRRSDILSHVFQLTFEGKHGHPFYSAWCCTDEFRTAALAQKLRGVQFRCGDVGYEKLRVHTTFRVLDE